MGSLHVVLDAAMFVTILALLINKTQPATTKTFEERKSEYAVARTDSGGASCMGACGVGTQFDASTKTCVAVKEEPDAMVSVPSTPISTRANIKVGVCSQRGKEEVHFFTAFAKVCFPNATISHSKDGEYGTEGKDGKGVFPVDILFCWPNWHYPWPIQHAMGNETHSIHPPGAGTVDKDGIAWPDQWPMKKHTQGTTLLTLLT
jgi:hypothetical protein